MKYKILFSILLIHLVLIVVVEAQNVDTIQSKLIEGVLLSEYKRYYTKEKLDRRFLKYLKKEKQVDMAMVNPGELFNETDMVIDGFPMKRLIAFGKGSGKVNFILYESGGGNASFTYGLIYQRYKNYYYTVLIRTDKLYTIEKFQEAIKNKQYEIW